MVVDVTGEIPAIVDGEDLIEDGYGVVEGYSEVAGIPLIPKALNWSAEFKPECKTWEEWHLDAAIRRRIDRKSDEAQIGANIAVPKPVHLARK